jgi:hypothetical protein
MHQLHKCYGACIGQESPAIYNQRLLQAFVHKRIQAWPYSSPVLVTEGEPESRIDGVVVDQWCIVGQLTQEPDCEPRVTALQQVFDLDTYKILQSYLTIKNRLVNVLPLTRDQIDSLYA